MAAIFVIVCLPLFLASSENVNRQRDVAQNPSSACSNSSGFVIHSQGDLDQLSSCGIVSGSIIISGVSMTSVNIPQGIQHVDGDITVSLTPTITSFSAPGLQSISGTFELLNLTQLQTLTAGSLSSVSNLTFIILPSLSSMTMAISEANTIHISDTELGTLDGISLTSVGDFGVGKSSYGCHNSKR